MEPVPFFAAWDGTVPSIRQMLELAVEFNDATGARFPVEHVQGPAAEDPHGASTSRRIGQRLCGEPTVFDNLTLLVRDSTRSRELYLRALAVGGTIEAAGHG